MPSYMLMNTHWHPSMNMAPACTRAHTHAHAFDIGDVAIGGPIHIGVDTSMRVYAHTHPFSHSTQSNPHTGGETGQNATGAEMGVHGSAPHPNVPDPEGGALAAELNSQQQQQQQQQQGPEGVTESRPQSPVPLEKRGPWMPVGSNVGSPRESLNYAGSPRCVYVYFCMWGCVYVCVRVKTSACVYVCALLCVCYEVFGARNLS